MVTGQVFFGTHYIMIIFSSVVYGWEGAVLQFRYLFGNSFNSVRDGQMDGWMDGWMDRRTDGRTD